MKELEELARRKREAPPRRAPPEAKARQERSEADRRIDLALSQVGWMGPVCFIPMVAVPVLLVAFFGALRVLVVLGLFAGTAVSMIAIVVGQRLVAARQRQRLARMPFELRGYLAYLAEEHPADATMTVTVELDAPPADADARMIIADAVTGAVPDASAHFEQGRLIIRSPAIHARFARKRGRARTTPRNHLLHAWFMKLVRRAILPIARAL